MFRQDRLILGLLKMSVVAPMLYASIASLISPNDWVSFIPAFTNQYAEPFLLLKVVSILQIVLCLMIIWGKWLVLTATIAALLLISIVATNWAVKDIFFRDLGLAFSALALALYSRRV